jgi:ABC-2 type transport system ATP-binding protein
LNVVIAESITKINNAKNAVDNINLAAPTDSIYGFIGRNREGKTKNMVCGLAYPTSGTVTLFDSPLEKQDIREQIGVLIEQTALYPDLSVRENLMFIKHLSIPLDLCTR